MRCASVKAPCLNGFSRPSAERVPSGNIMIELPSASVCSQAAIICSTLSLVAAPQLDVAVQRHVPADAGDAEVLDLRHPLEVREEAEEDQDVEQRLVVGDHHVGGVGVDLLAPLDAARATPG